VTRDRRTRTAAALLAAGALAVLAGCGSSSHDKPSPRANTGLVAPTPTTPAGPTTPACPQVAPGFDCDMQQRITAVQDWIKQRPGIVGVVLRDRQTGATWHNENADTLIWTGSTIKLAMIVDLYTRDHAGAIHLTADDREQIHQMLHVSSDNAADAMWKKYGRDDFATRFGRYGLTGATFVKGFQRYWGFMKCSANDLDRMINYVLTDLPAADRSYIVDQLQHVWTNQQWGVWGAGPQNQPGNKDGWSLEQGGWETNSVGFAGPNQRYTLAIMNNLNGKGGYHEGVNTDTQIAALLFQGHQIAAPTTQPSP
jgi:hypothetical protein